MTDREKIEKASAYLWNKYGEVLPEYLLAPFEDGAEVMGTDNRTFWTIYDDEAELTITYKIDRESLDKVKQLKGIVEIADNLPNLEIIEGDATIGSGVKLPNLKNIVGHAVLQSGVEVPKLETIAGGLESYDRTEMPSLEHISGSIDIYDDDWIEDKFPKLQFVGGGINIHTHTHNHGWISENRKDLVDKINKIGE